MSKSFKAFWLGMLLILGAGCTQTHVIVDPTDTSKNLAVCVGGFSVPTFCRVQVDKNTQATVAGASGLSSFLSSVPQAVVDTGAAAVGL